MKKVLFRLLTAVFATGVISSCINSDEKQISEVTEAFCEQYFTWHFRDAMPYADDNGQQWLRFMASSVHEADVELINGTTDMPEFDIDGIDMNGDTARAVIKLHDVILMDTLGKAAHKCDSATRIITLTRHDKQWRIHRIQTIR